MEKKEREKNWLKDKNNLLFLAVMVFAFLFRLYFFIITQDQPLWWDESEYMAGAKAYAGLADYSLSSIRAPGLSLFASIFFKLGIESEQLIKFFVAFIPSIIVLFLTYLTISAMYDNKRVALISTIILTVLWEHVFYSNRFHTENLALIFQFLAIFVLFKVYLKKEGFLFINPKYSLIWILALSAISIFFRPGNLIFFPAILLFVLIINTYKLTEKGRTKAIILTSLTIIVIAMFFMLKNLGSIPILSSYYHPDQPIAWQPLTVFSGFYLNTTSPIPSVLFYSFLIGLIICLYSLGSNSSEFSKLSPNSTNLKFKANLFNVLLLLGVLIAFIFFLRASAFEYRWFFPLLPAMLAITSEGIVIFSTYAGAFLGSKRASVFLIIVILSIGAYGQITHSDRLIKLKLNTYSEVREASIWIKKNTQKEEVVFSMSHPQTSYYSERKVITYSHVKDSAELEELILAHKPKYIIISIFENHPEFVYSWPQSNSNLVVPVKVYYADSQQQQPLLIIYEYKN